MRSRFGHITKEKNNRYRVFWQEGGTKHSKRCAKYKDACQFLAEKELSLGNIDNSITYTKFYNASIVPEYKHLAARTVTNYKYAWSLLQPHIGKTKVVNTNWRMVQSVLDKQSSYSTQKLVLKLWKKMCGFAVRDELLRNNPCVGKFRLIEPNRKTKQLYTKNELVDVLLKIYGTEFALPVLLECCCGLRHEEYCALNNRDFEFVDVYENEEGWCFISILKALTNDNGRNVLKEPKTATSNRIVALAPRFREYILEHNQFMKNKRRLSDYINPGVLNRRWKRYCEKNDIRYVPFGHMRSAYATLAAEAGCLDSLISKAMGHAGLTVKERNYQTATMRALKLNAEMFGDYLGFEFPTQ